MLSKRWYFGLLFTAVVGAAFFGRPEPSLVLGTAGEAKARADEVPALHSSANEPRATLYQFALLQELAPEGGQPARSALHALLEITPRDDSGRDLVRLSEVRLEGELVPKAKELELVFGRVHDRTGRLASVEFARGASPETRALLKAVASAIQFTGAPHAGNREWQVEEFDVGGRFTSSYRRLDRAHVERFQRRLVGNASAAPLVGMELSGSTRFGFDAEGILSTLETHERADLSAGDSWRMEARLSVSLTRLDEVPAEGLVRGVGFERESVVVDASDQRDSPESDRARLAGRFLEDLRGETLAAERLERMDRVRERSRLLLDHAALVRLDSSVASEIGALLADDATSGAEVSLLAGSLGAAGTLEATHTLTEVLADSRRPEVRMQAVVSLNLAGAHDAATLAALMEATRDEDAEIAAASMLALGNASRTLRNVGGTAPHVAELLADAYRNAGGPKRWCYPRVQGGPAFRSGV